MHALYIQAKYIHEKNVRLKASGFIDLHINILHENRLISRSNNAFIQYLESKAQTNRNYLNFTKANQERGFNYRLPYIKQSRTPSADILDRQPSTQSNRIQNPKLRSRDQIRLEMFQALNKREKSIYPQLGQFGKTSLYKRVNHQLLLRDRDASNYKTYD